MPAPAWEIAARAAQARKAEDIVVLDISVLSSFTDVFLLCTGRSQRQLQAIADAIEDELRAEGWRPLGVEGRRDANWILMDYGDFVIHILTPEARKFYDIERLWRAAPRLPVAEAAETPATA